MPRLTQRAAATPRPDAPAPRRHPLVGIVGGMGPLASTELLRSVYHPGGWAVEQHTPRVLLWSDPAVVDRTAAIDDRDLGPLRSALERSVGGLAAAGAERVVIACVTAHLVLGDLPPDLARRCVSLIEVIRAELAGGDERHLLLCTTGTARAGILDPGPAGPDPHGRLVRLAADDQEAFHREIYRVKSGGDPAGTIGFLRDLLPRYGVRSFVAACTELHLVVRAIEDAGLADAFPSVDPLTVVARRIRNGEL
ncbi:aspartate racemase [Streptomyces capparidis]